MKKVKLQKIEVQNLIQLLQHLYSRGAMYIDIIGSPDIEQDELNIIVKNEYIEPNSNFFDEFSENFVENEHALSDDDLNLLIDA